MTHWNVLCLGDITTPQYTQLRRAIGIHLPCQFGVGQNEIYCCDKVECDFDVTDIIFQLFKPFKTNYLVLDFI